MYFLGVNLRIADLHTHSSYSDGALAPGELVQRVAQAGIAILALTDHDTIAGNPEAAAEARSLGIEFVPGIEISAHHEGVEYHVLGHFVDEREPLQGYVDLMRLRRRERLREMASRLGSAGVAVDADRLAEIAKGTPTRAHLAQHLVEIGEVDTVSTAFRDYLGAGCAAYVPAATVSVEEAIRVVHEAGGCASLAHPGDWFDERKIGALCELGLDGIEVVHPSHDQRLTDYYEHLATRYGLAVTGGSDFHGSADGLSSVLGTYSISEKAVDTLRVRARRLGSSQDDGR